MDALEDMVSKEGHEEMREKGKQGKRETHGFKENSNVFEDKDLRKEGMMLRTSHATALMQGEGTLTPNQLRSVSKELD